MTMTMTIFAKVKDEGAMGARLTVYNERQPRCPAPGLGGWKKATGVTWWTRVKGPAAAALCAALRGAENPYMAIRVAESGQIMAIAQLSGDDTMDEDLADAQAAGALTFRPI